MACLWRGAPVTALWCVGQGEGSPLPSPPKSPSIAWWDLEGGADKKEPTHSSLSSYLPGVATPVGSGQLPAPGRGIRGGVPRTRELESSAGTWAGHSPLSRIDEEALDVLSLRNMNQEFAQVDSNEDLVGAPDIQEHSLALFVHLTSKAVMTGVDLWMWMGENRALKK